jgi:cobalt-precorrin-5B (C1)-methyltransferase
LGWKFFLIKKKIEREELEKESKKKLDNLREGFTTGACSAAAAKAATKILISKFMVKEIETTLPNKRKETFLLNRCEVNENTAICSVIKDAGDDPDCTHGAELVAEVSLNQSGKVTLFAGDGVAKVTKKGLGLDVGGPAINPVPRKNIIEMVREELAKGPKFNGAFVTISVPKGKEMAKKTLNERLGLIGGISILGTTGIVRPYSTAAYRASVVQAIELAKEQKIRTVILTTGGKSEQYAQELFPDFNEMSFIQVGDFIGTGLKQAHKNNMCHVIIVGMMGKLSKMADGKMMTHAAGSKVNMKMLAEMARGISVSEKRCLEIEESATARRVLEICEEEGALGMTSLICKKVVEKCLKHINKDEISISSYLVDFKGNLLGKSEMIKRKEVRK